VYYYSVVYYIACIASPADAIDAIYYRTFKTPGAMAMTMAMASWQGDMWCVCV